MKGNSLLMLLLILASLSACHKQESQGSPVPIQLEIKSIGITTVENYTTNSSAINILKKDHNVTGIMFVKCIDDVCSNSNLVWSFYVNKEKVLYNPSWYHPRGEDIITFSYEEIK